MSSVMCVFVFFFKQKTAYEMRISDWSSDVCSSDLAVRHVCRAARVARTRQPVTRHLLHLRLDAQPRQLLPRGGDREDGDVHHPVADRRRRRVQHRLDTGDGGSGRSEEHTSELQSLMRISYAVICLKKKKQIIMYRQ